MARCLVMGVMCSLLVACGGGSTVEAPPQSDLPATLITPNGLRVLDTLPDGSKVVRYFNEEQEYPQVYLGYISSQAVGDVIFGRLYSDAQDMKTEQSGNAYRLVRHAMYKDGDVDMILDGLSLNNDGSEFVARVAIDIDGIGGGYLVTGTPVQSLPEQSVTFSGVLEVTEYGTTTVSESGNFEITLTPSATSGAATLSGTAGDFVVAATNIIIDPSAGEFSSFDAKIGSVGNLLDADMIGSFFGHDASGVGGAVTSTQNSSKRYIGSFIGTR